MRGSCDNPGWQSSFPGLELVELYGTHVKGEAPAFQERRAVLELSFNIASAGGVRGYLFYLPTTCA